MAVALHQVEAVARPVEALLDAIPPLLYDGVLAIDYRRQFHAYRTRLHAEAGSVSRDMRGTCACDHGLGRRAATVDADTTQVTALDQRNSPALVRVTRGQRDSGLAAAHHDHIVLHRILQSRTSGLQR
jgi:hypothetical protein